MSLDEDLGPHMSTTLKHRTASEIDGEPVLVNDVRQGAPPNTAQAQMATGFLRFPFVNLFMCTDSGSNYRWNFKANIKLHHLESADGESSLSKRNCFRQNAS